MFVGSNPNIFFFFVATQVEGKIETCAQLILPTALQLYLRIKMWNLFIRDCHDFYDIYL